MRKRWKCSLCGKTYCRLGKWIFRHFRKLHTDAVPHAEDMVGYDITNLEKPIVKKEEIIEKPSIAELNE
jgi:hypothetical protein